MKYIITESKIDMLMTDSLNNWVGSRILIKFDNFIILEDPNGEENNEVDLEYDGRDGRLWFRKNFRIFLSDLFGKDHDEIMSFVGKFFEYKFGVQVIKVE